MDFISDIFGTLKEMFADDFVIGITVTILSICLALLILTLVVLILSGIFRAIDSWLAPKAESYGVVISKEFKKGFYVHNGYYPDTYLVTIRILSKEETKAIDKENYQALSINDEVRVAYVIGRLSGEIYIRNFEPLVALTA